MIPMPRVIFCTILSVVLILTCAGNSSADSFKYTFESPNFLIGQFDFSISAPNIGASTFSTMFTCSVPPCLIRSVPETGPLTGQMLFPASQFSLIRLNFSTPVNQLVVDFGLIAVGAPIGQLRFTSPSGNLNQATSDLGSEFGVQGGTLTFASSIPFSTATLQGFTNTGAPTLFAIDNLTLVTPVPELDSLSQLGLGIGALIAWHRKRFGIGL
jgi:hypothetical protein